MISNNVWPTTKFALSARNRGTFNLVVPSPSKLQISSRRIIQTFFGAKHRKQGD